MAFGTTTSGLASLPQAAAPSRIHGAGEMTDLIRAKDWSLTLLGALEEWSETMVAAVNLMLLCPFAFATYWGQEQLLLYNDGFRQFLGGKHPGTLGCVGREAWPEAWPMIGPMIQGAFHQELVTNSAEVLIPVVISGELQDRWWTYCLYPLYEDGRIAGVANIVQDVTGAVLARKQLKESESRAAAAAEELEQVLAVTTDSIVSVNRDWIMTYFNPAAAVVFSSEERGLVGQHLWEAFPDAKYEGSPYVEHYERAMYEGISSTFEAHYPDPLNIWLRIDVHPTRDGFATFARDVTEQKKSMAALLQTEKLAAVGRLAASIAHEINNPLESVMNLLYLARISPNPADVQEYLETAERELRRVAVISNQTLRFHRQSTRPQAVTCTDLFSNVLSIFHGKLVNSGVEIEKRKRATVPIECFDGEIRQVLNNLVGNAIDAMHPRGGRLLVRSRDATDWKTGKKGLVLTVADTGSGMPPEVRRKAFEAFYTTKGIGGTGLGLWLSKEIVDRHKGTLRLRTSQQAGHSGTVFALFLPLDAVRR